MNEQPNTYDELWKSFMENPTTKDIANQLNEYSTDINISVTHDLPKVNLILPETVNDSIFRFRTNCREVCSIIDCPENKFSSGDDEVRIIIVKRTSSFTVPYITELVNQFISQGVFPDILENAKAILVRKSSTIHEGNYRPKLILNVRRKNFERFMHNKLY